MEKEKIKAEELRLLKRGFKVKLVNAVSKYKQRTFNGIHVFDSYNDDGTILVTETGKATTMRYIIKENDLAMGCIGNH